MQCFWREKQNNNTGFQARSRGGRWSWTLKLALKRTPSQWQGLTTWWTLSNGSDSPHTEHSVKGNTLTGHSPRLSCDHGPCMVGHLWERRWCTWNNGPTLDFYDVHWTTAIHYYYFFKCLICFNFGCGSICWLIKIVNLASHNWIERTFKLITLQKYNTSLFL